MPCPLTWDILSGKAFTITVFTPAIDLPLYYVSIEGGIIRNQSEKEQKLTCVMNPGSTNQYLPQLYFAEMQER